MRILFLCNFIKENMNEKLNLLVHQESFLKSAGTYIEHRMVAFFFSPSQTAKKEMENWKTKLPDLIQKLFTFPPPRPHQIDTAATTSI